MVGVGWIGRCGDGSGLDNSRLWRIIGMAVTGGRTMICLRAIGLMVLAGVAVGMVLGCDGDDGRQSG